GLSRESAFQLRLRFARDRSSRTERAMHRRGWHSPPLQNRTRFVEHAEIAVPVSTTEAGFLIPI
ncbi:MAG: hypothetical protein M3466_20000, partial [Gemmatimonadota bacterium]|nr:hypothetical protein [Gemmatimonadota bacterium]